jgi:hypothetical protein
MKMMRTEPAALITSLVNNPFSPSSRFLRLLAVTTFLFGKAFFDYQDVSRVVLFSPFNNAC